MNKLVKPEVAPSYTRVTGEIYDLIYSDKDYSGEATKITKIIEERCESGGNKILEAACGTGNYIAYLKDNFSINGFDLSAAQRALAKKKFPDLRIEQADMVDFDMNGTYDAVLCLFSSIGYLKTKENLILSIANMAKHTKPGGLVIVEPWLKKENLIEDHISLEAKSKDGLSVARMGKLEVDGILSICRMHHMIGSKKGIEHLVEIHELAMYSDNDFIRAFQKAGLEVETDSTGLTGRGLYIGKKPL